MKMFHTHLNVILLAALIALGSTTFTMSAHADEADNYGSVNIEQINKMMEKSIKRADRNRDGEITVEEAQRFQNDMMKDMDQDTKALMDELNGYHYGTGQPSDSKKTRKKRRR